MFTVNCNVYTKYIGDWKMYCFMNEFAFYSFYNIDPEKLGA